jgi:hypothetical protein
MQQEVARSTPQRDQACDGYINAVSEQLEWLLAICFIHGFRLSRCLAIVKASEETAGVIALPVVGSATPLFMPDVWVDGEPAFEDDEWW